MQENETLSVIDSLYATSLRGDLNAVLDLVSDDTEWIVYWPAELPFTGEFRGPSGVKEFLEALVTTQEEVKVEISDRIVQGNKALFVGTYTANGKLLSVVFAHIGLSKAPKSQN
jgi:ketosteroid isomerase-like protein